MYIPLSTVCVYMCACVAPQMLLKAEKSHKIDHREVYMMHRLDIQRLSGKKSKPEAG